MSASKLERLLNLTAALLDTPRPLTAEQLRQRVPGYPEDAVAFHRAFERDKDDLRDLGIPLRRERVVVEAPGGRRLPRPPRGVLPARPRPGARRAGVAAPCGAGRPPGGRHRGAVEARRRAPRPARRQRRDRLRPRRGRPRQRGRGLGAAGRGADRPAAAGAVRGPRRPPSGGVPLPGRTEVAAPGGAGEEERVVDPLRLDFQRGRWYLSGHDHGHDAARSFRVDRIVGDVEGPRPPGFRTARAPPPRRAAAAVGAGQRAAGRGPAAGRRRASAVGRPPRRGRSGRRAPARRRGRPRPPGREPRRLPILRADVPGPRRGARTTPPAGRHDRLADGDRGGPARPAVSAPGGSA